MSIPDEVKTKLKAELAALYKEGTDIFFAELGSHAKKNSEKSKQTVTAKSGEDEKPIHLTYQAWYSKAIPVVRQLLPERLREFQDQYRLEKRNDKNIDFLTFTISDYLVGLQVTRGYEREEVVNSFSAFTAKFQHQLTIFASIQHRIYSRLSDIEGILQTELFRHELDAADDLHKKKHLRAAGAIAGVALETHLGRVCVNHGLTLAKKSPTISDYNEAMKTANVLDLPTWRLLQRLGDIRNYCVHAKEREPTPDEVADLLSGTRKFWHRSSESTTGKAS
jgi:hypothetical protein